MPVEMLKIGVKLCLRIVEVDLALPQIIKNQKFETCAAQDGFMLIEDMYREPSPVYKFRADWFKIGIGKRFEKQNIASGRIK